jgi:2-polyprenyl-6-methoxyphenol hydroxylase-like FAD-dependent oxidoreductase
MVIQNKQIAIVGGGPGGLTLARLLQLKGANVKVYERDYNKDARVQGSPLDMHRESGAVALRKANLTDEFNAHVRIGADKKIVVNERAEIFLSDHQDNLINDDGNQPDNPEIDRGALRKIFLEALQPGTVIWDSHFTSMDKQDEGWLLRFKNGATAYADLVVAADGANSKIRPYITNIKAFYSRITMVEITVPAAEQAAPHIFKLLNGGKVMAFGNGRNILGGQKGHGELGFYLSLKANESWAVNNGFDYGDKAQWLAWFKKEYTGWSNIWYGLFENAVTPFIPRPIYCMPLDQTWEAMHNLTLMGDAAHVMPPFAGEGANTAMFDALELSKCLTSGEYNTLQQAIYSYEMSMRTRASAAAKQSLENGERMHSTNALEKTLAVFGKKERLL